jgi:hypothetical protein
MWTRRETVVGGALTLLFGVAQNCSCASASSAPHSMGCLLADADFHRVYPHGTPTMPVSGDEPIIYNSGDRNFDFALAQTLAKISRTFGVMPGFAYYDDSGAPNAFATSKVRLKNRDGTVLMGINLFRQLRNTLDSPEVAVAGVCSHEFGHIVQFKYGLIDKLNAGRPTIKRSELQADYLAGYFAGIRKRERPNYPAAVVAVAQHSSGDNLFNNPNHHGSPRERGAAVVRGFEASFRENKNLYEAIQESTNYVLQL